MPAPSNSKPPKIVCHRLDVFDSYDIALLSALIEDPRLTMVELSKIVHLSRSAISRRIEVLRDRGVLFAAGEVVSYPGLGFEISAVVELSLSTKNLKQVKEHLFRRPEVLSIAIVSGDGLLMIRVIAKDMPSLKRFVEGIQRFGDTTTFIEFEVERSKLSLVDRLARMNRHEDHAT